VLLIPDLLRRRISLPRALAGYGDSDGGERRQAGIELEPFPGVACGLVPVRRARLGEDVARTPARAGAGDGRGRHRVAVHFPLARTQLPFDPYATVQDCDRVYAMVKQYPGDRVLSENVGALVLAGKTVWVSNPFVYSQLVMRGSWPDAGLERMVRNREFDLIVTQWNYPMYPNFMSDGAEALLLRRGAGDREKLPRGADVPVHRRARE
jgi:hypothetical protein